jgi:hypothetical protein
MLVSLSPEQYDWITENAPFQVSVSDPEHTVNRHCPACGHHLATGHYPGCSRCPADRLYDFSALCTCGHPNARDLLHRYDGAPCDYLHRVDL